MSQESSVQCVAILTQSSGHNGTLAARLREKEWQVYQWPALYIEPMLDAQNLVPLPEDFDLVIFVSANAAQLYLRQLAGVGLRSWPANCTAATVGPSTAATLRESGWFGEQTTLVYPGMDAPQYDSEALWQCLCEHMPKFRRILIVRAVEGRDWLMTRLREAGATVFLHEIYRRLPRTWQTETQAQLLAWAAQNVSPVWLITSRASLAAVQANIMALGLLTWWKKGHFVLIHPRLASRFIELGVARAQLTVCRADEEAISHASVFGLR